MIDLCTLGLPATISTLPPHPLLLHYRNHQTLILPHSLRLFFLPHSNWYHIHGNLYPHLQQYHYMWLLCLIPRPWWNILFPIILGCRHPHNNRLVHSCCRRHHYGGSIDHLSGCQKILRPPPRPRGFSPWIHSKIVQFSISGFLYYLPRSSTLAINSSVIGNSVHIKPCTLHPVLRYMK